MPIADKATAYDIFNKRENDCVKVVLSLNVNIGSLRASNGCLTI